MPPLTLPTNLTSYHYEKAQVRGYRLYDALSAIKIISFNLLLRTKLWWTSILNSLFLWNLKCRFILFQKANVHLCTRFGDLICPLTKSENLGLPAARIWNNILQGDHESLQAKYLINADWSSRVKNLAAGYSKIRVMLRVQYGDQPSRNGKNLNSFERLGSISSVQ